MTLATHHFHRDQNGTPLVLLHAFPIDHRMWLPVIEHLPQVPIVALDAPGFGASKVVADGLENYATAIAQTLEAEQISRAVFAGVSMGGYAMLALAHNHGSLFAGMALMDTKAHADPLAAQENRLAMARQAQESGASVVADMLPGLLSPATLEHRPDLLTQVQQWASESSGEAIAWAQRSMAARPDRLDVLSQYRHLPAAVIRGIDDAGASHSDHLAMAQVLGVEVDTIDHAGHYAALEKPEEVAEILLRIWQKASRGI